MLWFEGERGELPVFPPETNETAKQVDESAVGGSRRLGIGRGERFLWCWCRGCMWGEDGGGAYVEVAHSRGCLVHRLRQGCCALRRRHLSPEMQSGVPEGGKRGLLMLRRKAE